MARAPVGKKRADTRGGIRPRQVGGALVSQSSIDWDTRVLLADMLSARNPCLIVFSLILANDIKVCAMFLSLASLFFIDWILVIKISDVLVMRRAREFKPQEVIPPIVLVTLIIMRGETVKFKFPNQWA
jgi:hypothetical protein